MISTQRGGAHVCVLFKAKNNDHSFDGFVVDNDDGSYSVSYFPTRCVHNNHNITSQSHFHTLFCIVIYLLTFILLFDREGPYSLSVQVNGMELKGFPLDVGMISYFSSVAHDSDSFFFCVQLLRAVSHKRQALRYCSVK
jgi:hypothetical protein